MRAQLACLLLFPVLLFSSLRIFGGGQDSPGVVIGTVSVWGFDFQVGRVTPRTILPGTQVFLRQGDFTLVATSDHAGKFRFDGVPAGSYEASCLVPKPFVRSGPEIREVNVTAGKTVRVDFSALTEGSISGRVLGRSGVPLSGIPVCLGLPEPMYPAAPHAMRTRSDANGFFVFHRVPPGRYHLGLRLDPEDPPDLPYPRIYFPGVGTPSRAAVIELGEGEELANIDLVLPERLTERLLAGQVTLPGGRPAASARVVLEISDYPYLIKGGETTTDSLGRFSLRAFNGLSYQIRGLGLVGKVTAETEAMTVPSNGPLNSLVLPLQPRSGPRNLLVNPSAELGFEGWIAYKESLIDRSQGDACFALRNQAYVLQDVGLPEGSIGKYALLFARAATERVNDDGSITGLPCLYGYMMMSGHGRILSYLQGDSMLFAGKKVEEWQPIYGIFPIPPETGVLRFFLQMAERKGNPQNGSLARFDDLGLYLFDSEEEARLFVDRLRKSEWVLRERAESSGPADSVVPPNIALQCSACITEGADAFQQRGQVVLKCEIGPDGRASECQVQRGLAKDLDQIAIEVVKSRWVFTPATRNGTPTSGSILVEVPLADCPARR